MLHCKESFCPSASVLVWCLICLQEVKSATVSDKSHFRNELILAENALECAECVTSVNKDALAAYKSKFDVSSRGTSSSGSAGVGKCEETLRSTPPTGSVNYLVTLTD